MKKIVVNNWNDPIHPGEILREEIETIGISPWRMARLLQIPNNRLYGILEGTRSITADTALRLSKFFGTSPQFWLNLQQSYELDVALQGEVKGIDKITPLAEMQKEAA